MRAYQNSLLDPPQVAVCLIDHEPQMFFGVENACRNEVLSAVTGLAKTAQVFKIPVILSTVEANTFSGPLVSRVQAVFPNIKPIDRTKTVTRYISLRTPAREAAGRPTIWRSTG